jgi:hypothetical protein
MAGAGLLTLDVTIGQDGNRGIGLRVKAGRTGGTSHTKDLRAHKL